MSVMNEDKEEPTIISALQDLDKAFLEFEEFRANEDELTGIRLCRIRLSAELDKFRTVT